MDNLEKLKKNKKRMKINDINKNPAIFKNVIRSGVRRQAMELEDRPCCVYNKGERIFNIYCSLFY